MADLSDRRAAAVDAVTKALTLCEPTALEVHAPAGFELAAILLRDALDVLTDDTLELFDDPGLEPMPPTLYRLQLDHPE